MSGKPHPCAEGSLRVSWPLEAAQRLAALGALPPWLDAQALPVAGHAREAYERELAEWLDQVAALGLDLGQDVVSYPEWCEACDVMRRPHAEEMRQVPARMDGG